MADLIDGYYMLFSGKKQSLVFKKLGMLIVALMLYKSHVNPAFSKPAGQRFNEPPPQKV